LLKPVGFPDNLAQITPQPRQAFLLVALERFSEADAASILGIDVEGLREFVPTRLYCSGAVLD
jgi:DNA-directed RNA polymerase specialized sigma24 family protein